MKKTIFTFLSSLGLIFSTSGLISKSFAADFISIGTGGPTGVYFVVGNSVCRIWREKHGCNLFDFYHGEFTV